MTPWAKVLILADPHIRTPGDTIIGLDPGERLRAALAHALERHSDAANIVLLGDLTHFGSRAEYSHLRDILADCPLPVTLTLGNHDRRAGFDAVFPDAIRDANGFAQCGLDLDSHRVLILDTLDEDGIAPHHGGYLCDRRLDWLRAQLTDPRPTAVLCHHPPFATGFAGMDAIGLSNGDTLLAILKAHPHVTLLICGHIHRTISGAVGGLAVAVVKSPCHQMPMILGDASSAVSEDAPGGYGILLATRTGWIVQTDDVSGTHIAHDAASESS